MPIVPTPHESIGQKALRSMVQRDGHASMREAGLESGHNGPAQPVIIVEHLHVAADRVIVDIDVTNSYCAFTSAQLIEEIEEYYPHIRDHACVNDRGPDFGAVAEHTSILHLLEHMVIEGQVRNSKARDAAKVFVGKSYWTDRPNLRGKVEVNYADDLVALGAIKEAVDTLNRLFIFE